MSAGTLAIDLNADLGESFGAWRLGDDDALLDVVTSANVACGFHGGDPTTLRRVCQRAAERGVAIGAQVSYPDLAGFGRRFLDVAPADLVNDVLYQIGALEAFARVAGSRVRYVKPHGALYHAVVTHAAQAEAVVEAVRRYDASLPVLGLPGSALLRAAAHAGLRGVPEAFADRGYTRAGGLVPRGEPGAVLTDPAEVGVRAAGLAMHGQLRSVDGAVVAVRAESVCVHGDSPQAAALARAVHDHLVSASVSVRPFA